MPVCLMADFTMRLSAKTVNTGSIFISNKFFKSEISKYESSEQIPSHLLNSFHLLFIRYDAI